jgi:hypothetical protein
MQKSDTGTGIGPFHAVAGMFIGGMGQLPTDPKIQAVLTVAAQPGHVPDGIHHRHLPISYQLTQMPEVSAGVEWVLNQVLAERTVLVRSEGGRQRPGLVVAMAVLMMGGYYHDALNAVRHARVSALTDFRYLQLLTDADKVLNQRRRSVP